MAELKAGKEGFAVIRQRCKTDQRLPKMVWWIGLVLLTCLVADGVTAKQLKYTEDRPPSTLNPVFADDMYSVRITELIFEGLIGWDKEQRPAPMLATRWKISADKKSITLTLRKGVKWHDGKPFTSKDVAFTIKTMTGRRSQIADRYLAQIVRSVKPIGDYQVKILFRKPLNKPLRWLQFKIIPAHRFRRGVVRRSDFFNQKPYGTGPFRFNTWVGNKIKLKRFKKHWRASKIRLRRVKLQAIADKNIQVEVLRYGGLDAIIRVRPKDIPVFERDQNIKLYPYSTNDWWYIGFNHKRGSVFRDRRVREAFVYALDRTALRAAHLGEGQTISGPFSPSDPLYNFSVEPRTQNRAKARKLLEAAGWKKKAGKRYRSKGGKELRVRFLISRSRTSYRGLCLAIQSELVKVGVRVLLEWLDEAAWQRTVFQKKDFDLTLHIWNFDELSSIYPLFQSRGARNYVSYKNKNVDRLLKQSLSTADPVIYKTIYGKLHKILHKDLPYLFLWSLTNYSAITAKVRNVTIHPFNYFHYAYSWSKRTMDD